MVAQEQSQRRERPTESHGRERQLPTVDPCSTRKMAISIAGNRTTARDEEAMKSPALRKAFRQAWEGNIEAYLTSPERTRTLLGAHVPKTTLEKAYELLPAGSPEMVQLIEYRLNWAGRKPRWPQPSWTMIVFGTAALIAYLIIC
jgi:hypothetical protein